MIVLQKGWALQIGRIFIKRIRRTFLVKANSTNKGTEQELMKILVTIK